MPEETIKSSQESIKSKEPSSTQNKEGDGSAEKSALATEDQQKKEKALLNQKYKEKGFQQLSFEEYLALKRKEKKRYKKTRLPGFFKIIFSTPFLILFCFGLFYIPYLIYLIITRPYVGYNTPKKDTRTATDKISTTRYFK